MSFPFKTKARGFVVVIEKAVGSLRRKLFGGDHKSKLMNMYTFLTEVVGRSC